MLPENLISWLNNNSSIKVAILTGSFGSNKNVDELSDYDIALFGNSFSFIVNDEWLNEIEPFLICIHDQFLFNDIIIPTRLVIFNTSLKVDFSFHPMQILLDFIKTQELPDSFNIGYKVIIDKGSYTKDLPVPSFKGFILKKPSLEEFNKNNNEFWFEIYHAAKYLKRKDFWAAHSRHWAAKKQLLQMLQWDRAIKDNWTFAPKNEGRNISQWSDEKTMIDLNKTFWRTEIVEGVDSLLDTMDLYQAIAIKVANNLKFSYNSTILNSIIEFINKVL